MKLIARIIGLLLLGASIQLQAQQVTQNFNQSVNQIGDCWNYSNMKITTKNTINKKNHKKALTGTTAVGNPAYYFQSPFIQFNGAGTVEFKHKLDGPSGTDRSMRLVLLDSSENIVQVLHAYTYISGGAFPNGNPTTVVNVSIPVTWSGVYTLRWEFFGVGGTSNAMIDDIVVDGTDVSDGSQDNGYGYCRHDDVVYDTICAGQTLLHEVPYGMEGHEWNWAWLNGAGGSIDQDHIASDQDTIVEITWLSTASGDYVLEATETRLPWRTNTYNVTFYIHVLPLPTVALAIDTICVGEEHTATFTFTGAPDWTVDFTDGQNVWSETFTQSPANFTLAPYMNPRSIEVIGLVDGNGCPADPSFFPEEEALLHPAPRVAMRIDSICPGDTNTAHFELLEGDLPYTLSISDGNTTITHTFSTAVGSLQLPPYMNSTAVSVSYLEEGNGCLGNPGDFPNGTAYVYPLGSIGPIFHY